MDQSPDITCQLSRVQISASPQTRPTQNHDLSSFLGGARAQWDLRSAGLRHICINTPLRCAEQKSLHWKVSKMAGYAGMLCERQLGPTKRMWAPDSIVHRSKVSGVSEFGL